MAVLNRRTFILSALASPAAGVAFGRSSDWADQLSAYRVRDPMAGYFDFATRRKLIQTSVDPILQLARVKLMRVPGCKKALDIPIQDQPIVLPSFYEDNEAWKLAVKPFRELEDAVSDLAAANLFASDRRHADCLIELLVAWANRNGLANFNYSPQRRQGWFQVESTLFAVGFAVAAILPDVTDRKEDLTVVFRWLNSVARSHFSIPGESGGTCCNNHYYRRALYSAIIGTITDDDELFQNGVGAIYSALSHATREGALPLEMKRGPLAAHYQNFALMYLAMIAEIGERQGYPLWSLEIDGKTLHSLVDVNNRILANPDYVTRFSKTDEVSLRYRRDDQYFAWFEMYLARFRNDEMVNWIADRRPLYNRSLGGHMTVYFYQPG